MTRKLNYLLIKTLIGISIGEGIKFLAAFLFTTSTLLLGSNILTTVFPHLLRFKISISLVFLSGGLWMFLVLYYKLHRYRPKFPAINFDYRLLEKELTYEYQDKTHMVYKKRNMLKALKNNLDGYHDKYRWTGKGTVETKSAIKEHLFRESQQKCIWQFYEINFQKFLKKGETIETELLWDLEDIEGRAVPFFSATIEEPTDCLKFNLSLNPELGVKEAICEVSFSIGAKKPLQTKTVLLDRNGYAEWIINNPKLLHHYEMRWIF